MLPASCRATTSRRSWARWPRFSKRAAATRNGWPAPTKTSTASSSVSSWSASATPAGGCTPAAPATSRCRSICGSTCGARFRCCSGRSPTWWRRSPIAAAHAGEALMPSYTHLRKAQPVLVAHFFLSHAAALRRDYGRLASAMDEADACTLGIGRRRRHELSGGCGRARQSAWFLARRRQQHRRLVGSRLRVGVPARGGVVHGAPEPARRKTSSSSPARSTRSSNWPTPRPPAAA